MRFVSLFTFIASLFISASVLSAPSKLKSKEVILPSMVFIEGGEFSMGSENHKNNEKPKHRVTVDDFYMSEYEITVAQFREFIDDTGYSMRDMCWAWKNNDWGINMEPGSWKTQAYAPSEFHPVMCVSWVDAKAYAKWLSGKTGREFRLPSEAQWEYAYRAGTKGSYFFGEDTALSCEYGNVLDTYGVTALKRDFSLAKNGVLCKDYEEYTSVVGLYKPNAFGLFDMIGNVSEYVEDCQHMNYKDAPKDGSAWVSQCDNGSFNSNMKMRRGGSYGVSIDEARAAARHHAGETNTSSIGEGFRLVELVGSKKMSQKKNEKTKEYDEQLKQAQENAKKKHK